MQIYQYLPGEADWILLNWMNKMKGEGDLEHTLSEGLHTPRAFLNFFAARYLFYTLDSFANIQYAIWFEPCMGSAFMSYYVDSSTRSKDMGRIWFLYDMMHRAFEQVNTLACFVKEREYPDDTAHFIGILERLGFQRCGVVPYFFDGQHCHVTMMTKVMWERNNGRLKRRWIRERSRGNGRYGPPVASGSDAGTFASANHVYTSGR